MLRAKVARKVGQAASMAGVHDFERNYVKKTSQAQAVACEVENQTS